MSASLKQSSSNIMFVCHIWHLKNFFYLTGSTVANVCLVKLQVDFWLHTCLEPVKQLFNVVSSTCISLNNGQLQFSADCMQQALQPSD